MRRSEVALGLALAATIAALFSAPALADAPVYCPTEIAVDGSGNVYVLMGPGGTADAGLYVYGPDGNEIKSYRLDEYVDLGVGIDGSLYLSNIRKSYVERKAPNGTSGVFWREDSPGRYIDYIATGSDGIVYVTDFYIPDQPLANASGRILKLSPGGTITGMIEGSPTLPMNIPFKLSVSDNGTIYRIDFDRHVRAIFPDGSTTTITPAGDDSSPDDQLVDITAGADGYLYVVESVSRCIYRLAPNGTILARWDGCGPARFVKPYGVATDGNGRVYVSDMELQSVVWFDENYRFGANATENAAGQGLMWDTVVDSATKPRPLPGEMFLPGESIPGYTVALAAIGIGIAGVLRGLRKGR